MRMLWRSLALLKDERRVGAAETETVRHGGLDAGALNTLGHERHPLNSRVRFIDID